jgi:GDP-4-dehydro-6-deoxy-D-mannose reductase
MAGDGARRHRGRGGEIAPRRVLVTGGAGFAGRHLVDLLRAEGVDCLAPSRRELDLRDGDAVAAFVGEAAPAAVIHLAALSSVARSWERAGETLLGNVEMTLNLLEAVRGGAPEAAVVLVDSGQVYGVPDELPVTEAAALRPGSPYAVSKASCELLGSQYARAHGMRVVQMRSFNHAGPGQSEEYVLSSLTRQIAAAEVEGRSECVLRTGNPDSARDFTDVRDVVRAYYLVADREAGAFDDPGSEATEDPGSRVFNVCSGKAVSVSELVEAASACAQIPVRHEVDESLVRANDIPTLYGSHDRLTEACGWKPEIPLERTVLDALGWWRMRLAAQA